MPQFLLEIGVGDGRLRRLPLVSAYCHVRGLEGINAVKIGSH